MLEVLFEALSQRIRDLMKSNELFDSMHLRLVASRAAVDTLNDGAHVTEYECVHESFLFGKKEAK
jgi:hypothetical protein